MNTVKIYEHRIEAAARAWWESTPQGVAATYSGQTWEGDSGNINEEIREHHRKQVRLIVTTYISNDTQRT